MATADDTDEIRQAGAADWEISIKTHVCGIMWTKAVDSTADLLTSSIWWNIYFYISAKKDIPKRNCIFSDKKNKLLKEAHSTYTHYGVLYPVMQKIEKLIVFCDWREGGFAVSGEAAPRGGVCNRARGLLLRDLARFDSWYNDPGD